MDIHGKTHAPVTVTDTGSVNLTITGSQVLTASVIASGVNHSSLSGLTTTDAGHTQFALLAGRAGGQILYGGLNLGESLTIGSNAASGTNITLTDSALDLNIGGFAGSLTHANTDSRTYTLPDATGTVALTSEFTDQLNWFSNITMSGRLWGGIITDNGDGTVAIAAGGGLSKTDDAGPSAVPTSLNEGQGDTVHYVSWDAVASLALTDNAYNYIYYDYETDSILATTNYYAISFTREFTLGRAYRSGTSVTVRLCGTNTWNFNRRVQLFGEEVYPVKRASGMIVSETGTRNIAVTAGVLWAELVNRFTTTAFDSSGAGRFTYWYRNGVGGWTSVATQSQINNTQYDDGDGTLGTLTANRYGVHWVYVVHDSSVHVVYGQGDYLLAQAQITTPPATLPGIISSYATLVARIIIQKSSATFEEIDSAFDIVLGSSSVTSHNDLSGIQGGAAGEYYHLTSAEQAVVQATSGSNTGDQLTFKTIAVAGQDDVVADTATDTLTLAAGSNITITTDAATDTVTIASSAGAGGVTSLNTLTGDLTIAGTTNQITVTPSGSTLTLSTPQDIHTAAAPTFARATLTGGTITASAPAITATQTWNNAAVTFAGFSQNVTPTAAAVTSYSFRFTIGSAYFQQGIKGNLLQVATLDTANPTAANDLNITFNNGTYSYTGFKVAVTNTASSTTSRVFNLGSGSNTLQMNMVGGLLHTVNLNSGSYTSGISSTQTWNNAGFTDNGLLIAVTDTASATASRLIKTTVGGTEMFAVGKDGRIYAPMYQFLGGTVSVLSAAGDNNKAAIGGAFTFNSSSPGAYTYHGILVDLTDTSSAVASSLIYMKTDGSERFRQYKDGRLNVATAEQTSNVGNVFNFTTTLNAAFVIHSFDVDVTNTASGAGSTKFRVTTDTTPDLRVMNTGSVVVGNAALATNATTGFFYFPSMAGEASGTPTAFTGLTPMAYDTTNNQLQVYDSGWQVVGDMVKLDEASGAAASYSFTNIPSGYRNLIVVWSGRSDTAATNAVAYIRVNNDANANYDFSRIILNGTNFGYSGGSINQTYYDSGAMAAASVGAGRIGSGKVIIHNYADTTLYKSFESESGARLGNNAADMWNFRNTGEWRSTSAITRVDVIPSAGSFVAGSVATLYGQR